jgi:hypothetical protein
MARSKSGKLFSRTEFVDHKPSPELLMWKSVIALAASDATKSIKNRPTYTSWTDNDIDRARNWFTAPSQDFALVCHLAGYNHLYIKGKMERVIRKLKENERR